MRASLDSDHPITTFRHEGKVTRTFLTTERTGSNVSIQKEFTSDDLDSVSSGESESEREHGSERRPSREFVLMLNKGAAEDAQKNGLGKALGNFEED